MGKCLLFISPPSATSNLEWVEGEDSSQETSIFPHTSPSTAPSKGRGKNAGKSYYGSPESDLVQS